METPPVPLRAAGFPRHQKAGDPDRQVEPAAPPDRGRLPSIAHQDPPTETQNMSNATPDTRGPGGERRRQRSRGGKGRNRSRQGNDQGGNPNRSQHQGDRQRGDRGESRGADRGPRPPRREYKPVPLTWWQKLLKAIGLYKEPVRPPRPEKQESIRFEEGPPREVKSNTRNARQGGGDSTPRPPRERSERTERSERPDRGNRGERSERPDRAEASGTRIYLGNLSYEATEEDLKDLFKGVGTVRNVEIVYNRRTHKSKGYGFVDMLNVDEARRSIEILHDQFFMGRKLVVSGAKTKDHEDESKDEDAREEAAANAERKAAAAAATAATAAEAPEASTEEAPAPSSEEIAANPEPAAETVAETVAELPAEEAPAEERTA